MFLLLPNRIVHPSLIQCGTTQTWWLHRKHLFRNVFEFIDQTNDFTLFLELYVHSAPAYSCCAQINCADVWYNFCWFTCHIFGLFIHMSFQNIELQEIFYFYISIKRKQMCFVLTLFRYSGTVGILSKNILSKKCVFFIE